MLPDASSKSTSARKAWFYPSAPIPEQHQEKDTLLGIEDDIGLQVDFSEKTLDIPLLRENLFVSGEDPGSQLLRS